MQAGYAHTALQQPVTRRCQPSRITSATTANVASLRPAHRTQRQALSKQAGRAWRQQRQRCQPCTANLTFSDSSSEWADLSLTDVPDLMVIEKERPRNAHRDMQLLRK